MGRSTNLGPLGGGHRDPKSPTTALDPTLSRKAAEIIAELEIKRDPVLITQHGRPAPCLVDVETYEDTQRRLAILEGIARGERAIEEGCVVSHAEAKKRMTRWLG